MMAKITCNGPNKNTLFNILPNKTKTHSLIYFQTKQKHTLSYTSKQNKNTLFNLLPNKTKKWRIKARWTIKVVAKIKSQIMSYFRNRQTRKQNKGEQKTLTNVVQDPVKDNREWLKTIEKNDPAKLNINQNKYNLQ